MFSLVPRCQGLWGSQKYTATSVATEIELRTEIAAVQTADKYVAVAVHSGKGIAYLATDGKKLARRVEARIGVRQPGRVELLGGVAAGDLVVTAGQSRLRGESAPVRVIDLSNPGGPRGPAGASRPAAARPASGAPPG